MISEHGFLSSDIDDNEAQLVAIYGALFSVSTELNVLLMKLCSTAQMDMKKEVDIVVHALAIRSVELFQSIVVPLRRGSIPPAAVLRRALIENAYKLRAVSSDHAAIALFNADETFSRLHKLLGIQKYKQKHPGFAVANNVAAEIVALSAKKPQKTNPSKWADLAHMSDFHNIYYQMLCDEAHANATAVSHYIDTNSEYQLNFGPTDKGLALTSTISNRTIICCIESYAKFLTVNVDAELQALSVRNDSLGEQFLEEKKP